MKKIIATIFTFYLVCLPAHASENIELVVVRSEHQLLVKQNGNILRTFNVRFGSGGRKAKLREGDHTTPKGIYRINRMRDSDRFHLFLQIDYPSINDAKRALKNHLISEDEYQDIWVAHLLGRMPPQDTALGGAIGIHGIGHETKDRVEIHQISDWTQGCIAMRNDEVDELSRYIDVGTQISILD